MNMSQTVWIARHGNRLDFVDPDWFFRAKHPYDPPLSEDGIIQAKQLGKRLSPENIKHIFASPFLRTVQTANQIAEILDLSIKIEPGLSEWLNPEWMHKEPEKLSLEELGRIFPRVDITYTNYNILPNYPETEKELLDRSGKTAKLLTNKYQEDILLVGHKGSVLGATMGLLASKEPPLINTCLCCLIKLVYSDKEWIMELNGDNS